MPKQEMSKSDSSRIQSSQAKAGGDMTSSGFAARAQGAADRHAAAGQGSAPTSQGGMGQSSGAGHSAERKG
ncbi:hypothetical protein ACRALDRAFT_1073757 [Sodiomyces alcalophilus JCM 7366]|uniref:uncharacterized protein n=1 Tax=Sodiomyces alcalophilus JCM 7366 TaxID=591952 RepID=UPI0039B590E5